MKNTIVDNKNGIEEVYAVTGEGVDHWTGKNAIRFISSIEENNDDKQPFMIYTQAGAPVYFAVGEATTPITFPTPDKYGTTAPELYAKAVTYRNACARLIQLRTKGKASWMQQAKKVMTLSMPIVVTAFLIFILVVSMAG